MGWSTRKRAIGESDRPPAGGPGSPDGWVVRLSLVEVPPGSGGSELVTSLLWDAGTTGIAEDGPRLLAGFTDRETAEAVAARAVDWPVAVDGVEALWWAGTDEASSVAVEGPDGRSAELTIVAGPTFGHGGHPTTALALELLAGTVEAGRQVLDVGTGSGVLAIAAATLGANPVVAIDIDPATVPVAQANAAANGIEIQVSTATIERAVRDAGRPFDVVVANVELPAQRALAGALAAAVAPGGSLITSGYLDRHRVEIEALHGRRLAGGPASWAAVDSWREREGWSANRFRRAGGYGSPS